jgi:hypothetical protein
MIGCAVINSRAVRPASQRPRARCVGRRHDDIDAPQIIDDALRREPGLAEPGGELAAREHVEQLGHAGNPNHATVDGLTAQQLEGLFSPTVPNPAPQALRGF